ncbi:MAG: hypothetical protein RBG13Loki_4162 [Promethearchaeota archaeon CR_4]|nr:MAG: hypothetical protein RBG13Loki_4162 [Candidatus Lokiarchaeota archaeon CR_4]
MPDLYQSLRVWNPWWVKGWVLPKFVQRSELRVVIQAQASPHVKDIIGPRRVGKTTLIYQIIADLLARNIPPEKIVFLNFDDINFNTIPLEDLTQTIIRNCPHAEYLFLDEIQEKIGWERWVRGLYDTKQFRQIFVTGSSASLLSEDIGQVLTGRHLTFTLLPFSFREYLQFHQWQDFDPNYLTREMARLLHFFDQYLEQGGFPEIVGQDDAIAHSIAIALFGDILARDIASRHSVEGPKLKTLAHYVMTNFAREFSFRRIGKDLGVHVETLERYVGYLIEAFLIFPVSLYDYKLRVQFQQNKKMYVIDTGLRNHVAFKTARNLGLLAENAVFLELKRRGIDIFYWKDGTHEVDFIARRSTGELEMIQVCWDPSDVKVREREVQGLRTAGKILGISSGIVLTQNYASEEIMEGISIHFVPLVLWMLNL